MNGRIATHSRTDSHAFTSKAIKGSYLPYEAERNGLRGKQISLFNDQWRGRGKAIHPPSYQESTIPKEPLCKGEGYMQFRNAEKLKHFEQLKSSNIDDLNCKIQRMINRLSDQVSPYSSVVSKESKARVKTDYSDLPSTQMGDSGAQDSMASTLDQFFFKESSEMVGSEVIKRSQIIQDRRVAENSLGFNEHLLGFKAEAIRKKYKAAPEGKQPRHLKTQSGLNHSSFLDQNHHPSRNDVELIRFRQKLKVNNERQRKELSRQLNFHVTSSIEKATPVKKKKNLDEQLKEYEKRLTRYDSKKLICLANQGQFQRVPLGDRTNNTSYLKYSPYGSKKAAEFTCKLKIKQEESFQPNIEDYQQTEQPLTADFRQPSDKNQLKVLLKSLQAQIALDEQFRNCKQWFSHQCNPSKWQQLSSKVQRSSLNLDQTALHEIFSLREQEQDPFFSPRGDEYDFQRMVQLFLRCQQHWFDNIVKKYNREQLLACGFRECKVDITGKGFLQIEDLVRFLSLQMDIRVRSRDLMLIFQRLQSEQELRFCELLEVFCSE